ncbi:MAG: hypothetical protein Q9198_005910 [Flavoplaca austrocitrina]
MHDTNDITPRPRPLIAAYGEKTESLVSWMLQRERQLEQVVAKLRRRIRKFQDWNKFSAMSLIFEPLRKKSDKDSFGEFLAYLSSPIEKNEFHEPVMKQLSQNLHWRVQLKGATDAYGNQAFIRLERIIMYTLKLQRCTAYPGRKSRFTQKQFHWLQANAAQAKAKVDQATKFLEQWVDWMISNPYDQEGILTDPWERRIRYFTSHQQKLELLAESSSFKLWSMFLDPTWWLRLRTNYYGMTLRQIINSPYTLSSVRTQLRLKYDASGYGRARKSSRLRKSIRAEVETAMPQMWNVKAVYGYH